MNSFAQFSIITVKFILFELKEMRIFLLALSGSGWGPECETFLKRFLVSVKVFV